MTELDKTMYFKATTETMNTARMLRENMVSAEKLLWVKIKGKQILGLRFRRQHPISIFIVDFYCHEARLVVEVDGKIHNQQLEYDDGRTAEMEKFYIEVIRFKNYEIEHDIDEVINKITERLKKRLESPPGGL